MAQPYLDELDEKLRLWRRNLPRGVALECKHFFSGAALYADGVIVASLTPVGLALKLPEETCRELLRTRKARRLRYFPNAPIKAGYARLSKSLASDPREVRKLLRQSIRAARERTS